MENAMMKEHYLQKKIEQCNNFLTDKYEFQSN